MLIAYEAYIAQKNKIHGAIIQLAQDYNICRQFVYILLQKFIEFLPLVFSTSKEIEKLSKKEVIKSILSYRFEGGMSIAAISTVMKRQRLDYSGKSTISQSLSTIGALLPSIKSIPVDKDFKITALLDEIFIGSSPILITVEPKSSVILNIELAQSRDGKTWSEHIDYLRLNTKINIINTVSDEGRGILAGIKNTLPMADRQPDTFHAISHRLGLWVSNLEKKAYASIENEYDREAVCLSRKTQKIFDKQYTLYIEACEESIKAIEIYENFSYLYRHTIKQLHPFHSNGEIRDASRATKEIDTALELIESLEHKKINTEIKSIKKILPQLLNYFEQSKKAIKVCKSLGISDNAIKTLSLAWQWDKAVIKAKNRDRKTKAKQQRSFYLESAKHILGDRFESIKTKVFDELDNIIQASSMVENINSILRPYLDRSKNQVTQEFLNLFAFYHNHRVYQSGKRKGKTPMEILTGEKQDKDWIELLLKFIEAENPSFFI